MTDLTQQQTSGGLDMAKLVMGVLLVTLGAVFLFDRMFWIDLHDVWRLWPLWLIAFGVIRVAWPRRGRSRLAGLWPIVIGGIFLLDTQHIMSIDESWPLFIVVAGLMMVLRSVGVGDCRRSAERVR